MYLHSTKCLDNATNETPVRKCPEVDIFMLLESVDSGVNGQELLRASIGTG